ncbi:hypothetical protein GCM10027586_00770 [Kineococcus gypseus]|uniref:DUF7426 family protein n=1 Tax=Kineococcus gypseus TaxID=1637102 RepID=UPI003D7D0A07
MSDDLRQMLAEQQPITRTIGGTAYAFPRSIPARIGLLLVDLMNGTDDSAEFFEGSERPNLRHELLGHQTLRQMVLDGCTSEEVDRTFSFLITWHTNGPAAAEKLWTSWGDAQGEASPAASTAKRPSSSTGAASRTRSRASTSGTSTRKATSRKAPRASS